LNLGFKQGGAAREAATSALFDTIFLGVGKGIKTYKAYKATNKNLSELGKEFKPALDVQAAAYDSPEALAQAQDLVLKQGQSISPLVAESAGLGVTVARQVGEMGFFSRPLHEEAVDAVQKIVTNTFEETVNSNAALPVADLGERVFGLVESAKGSARNIYGRQLEAMQSLPSTKKFMEVSDVRKAIEEFQDSYKSKKVVPFEKTTYVTGMEQDASNIVNAALDKVTGSMRQRTAKFDLKGLIAVEKDINNAINAMIPGSGKGNAEAKRQLSSLHDLVRKGVLSTLRKNDPALAKIYSKMQNEYSNAVTSITPKALQSMITNSANRESYSAIGQALVAEYNPEKINNIMKMINKSVAQIKKDKPKLDVKSEAGKIKQAIRATFLKEEGIIGEAAQEKIYGTTVIQKLLRQENRVKAVLGETWPEFKRMANTASVTKKEKQQALFSLAARSAELGAITSIPAASLVLTGGVTGAAAASTIGAAILVLASPVFLYKMTSKPALVNKYLALDNKLDKLVQKADPKLFTETILSGTAKLMEELSEEDQFEIRQSVSDANYQYN
ncbi:hypothetical protein N9D25_01815, partial [Alphaproteobacteria bacterium]|nr:hypothetical protein [Alphaproteobacteria bacterium]